MLLAQAAEKYNVQLIFGAELAEIDLENVLVTCKDGQSFEADLIVGADGKRTL